MSPRPGPTFPDWPQFDDTERRAPDRALAQGQWWRMGGGGAATLRSTFGFSPNREPRPRLRVVRRGRTSEVAVPAEPIGAEHSRQLDDVRDRLADPSACGSAIAGVRRIAGTIEAPHAAPATPLPTGPVATAAAT